MSPAKQERTCLVAALVLIGAGLTVWQFNRGTREPTYQGRTVSSWFRQYYRFGLVISGRGLAGPPSQGDVRRWKQAGKALDALGTNALPCLFDVCFSTNQDTWLQTHFPAGLIRLPKPFRGPPFVPASVVRAEAQGRVIGLKLTPAELLPSITNYLAAGNPAQRLTAWSLLLDRKEWVGRGLLSVGPPFGASPGPDLPRTRGVEGSTPWLARSLRSSDPAEQMLALEVITRFGPAFSGTLPDLIWLEAKSFQAESPALSNPSSGSLLWRCGRALGAMGTNAAPALPMLKEQLAQLVRQAEQAKATRPRPGPPPALVGSHRLFLAEAICRIDARELPAALGLLEEFQTGRDWGDLAEIAGSLQRIGPNAKPAIPFLLEALDRKGLQESDFQRVADVLRRIGADKRTLVRVLVKVLASQDPAWRINAAREILRYDPANAAAIQALIEIVNRGRHDEVHQAIPVLGDAGPAAKAAIPVLRRVINSQEKGIIADVLRREAAKALARIESQQAPK